MWFREMGSAKWTLALGGAYAAAMAGFLLWPRGTGSEELLLPGDRVLEGATQERVLHFDPGRDEVEAPSTPVEF